MDGDVTIAEAASLFGHLNDVHVPVGNGGRGVIRGQHRSTVRKVGIASKNTHKAGLMSGQNYFFEGCGYLRGVVILLKLTSHVFLF